MSKNKYNYIYKVRSDLSVAADFFYIYDEEENINIQKHSVMMEMCESLSKLSHCISFKVGSLIVKDWRIISTGINGTVAGTPNCDDHFNHDINFDRNEHHDWSTYNELHSEQNAIAIAAKNGINIDNSSMYLTLSPCVNCAKLIAAAGIKNIFFSDFYDFNENNDWYRVLLLSKVNIYRMTIDSIF